MNTHPPTPGQHGGDHLDTSFTILSLLRHALLMDSLGWRTLYPVFPMNRYIIRVFIIIAEIPAHHLVPCK